METLNNIKHIKKYDYFLMDLDGTITDPKEGITKSVAYALKQYGIETENLDSLCKFIGPPLVWSFENYYGFSKEQSLEATEKYREYYRPKGIFENYLYEGMEDLLKAVKARGAKLVLATSKPEGFAKQILEHFKIDHYFDFVAGSSLDTSRCEKGQVIEYALSTMNIPPESAIMVGDREHDVIGAKENELSCIGVLFGYGDREELEAANAKHIVKDVGELKELMLSMCRK